MQSQIFFGYVIKTVMCLITLSWQPTTKTPLIIAANRDEFYARPALPLHHWPDQAILAGKDVQAGGTWLGISQGLDHTAGATGVRIAALTNYRDTAHHRADAPSRGHITTSFLQGSMSAAAYLDMLLTTAASYNPFNLILFDGKELMGFESRHARAFVLPPGISAVSNADFNTPWPKLVHLRDDFEKTLEVKRDDKQLEKELFNLLAHDLLAPDAALPQTGIPLSRERALSAAFIRTPDYGTRACSVLSVGDHAACFTERSFDANGLIGEARERLSGF